MLRVLDTGRVSGHFCTLVTFHGTDAEALAVPREMRASRLGGDLEVLSQTPGSVTLRTNAPPGDPGSASVRLLAVLHLLEAFGPDAILEPFLFCKGRIRARLLVPKRLETQRVLLSLQAVQRSSGFSDFRIVRVTTIDAARYVDLLRRVLTPQQEHLLRIAAKMGYYETPKGATLEDIAGKVGLSVSPVHKRLKSIEEILVSSHIEPARAGGAPRNRRRRRAEIEVPNASPCEIALRVRWGSSQVTAFTSQNPGSCAMLQSLAVDPVAGTTTFLLVILADELAYPKLIDGFESRPDTLAIDIVDRDRTHCSVKLKLKLGSSGATFPWWTETWGQDALLRPLIFEEGECTLRFLVLRPLPEQEIRDRIAQVGKLAGWDEWELLAARSPGECLALGLPEPTTARQEEVLKIAHALGYYHTPRACTLEQVAATLGVSANAIHKNLSSAESKVVAGYLSAGV